MIATTHLGSAKSQIRIESIAFPYWRVVEPMNKTYFEKAFCISLDRHPGRWRKLQLSLPEDWPFPALERISAVNGRHTTPPRWWSAGKAAWGCYQSHLKVIERCLSDGIESCLILEDDAIFCDQFGSLASRFMDSVPANAEMIYLGGQHLATEEYPPVRVNAEVYIPYDVNRTHAYALNSRSAMMRLKRHLLNHDSWQTGHHIDHHLGQLISLREFPVYCPKQWLVGQDAGRSSISEQHYPRRFFNSHDWQREFSSDFVAVVTPDEFAARDIVLSLRQLGLFQGDRLIELQGGIPCSFELLELGQKYLPMSSSKMHVWEGSLRCDLFRWLRSVTSMARQRGSLAFGFLPQFCNWAPVLESLLKDRLKVVSIDLPTKETVRRHWIENPEVNENRIQRIEAVVGSRRNRQLNFLAETASPVLNVVQSQLTGSHSVLRNRLEQFVNDPVNENVNSSFVAGNR